MDGRTTRELNRITANIPPELAGRITKEIVDHSQEDMIREYLSSRGIPMRIRHKLQRLLEQGAFRGVTETVVDEDVVRELSAYHKYSIDKARREGKLGDPAKDAWLRERLARMDKASKR